MPLSVWTQSISEIASHLQSDPLKGISSEEAVRRLQQYGLNTLPKKGRVIWWKLLIGQFSSLIIWLLIGAAVIAGFLGEPVDSWAIVAIVILNASLGFFQEFRAERSLEALQKLAAPLSKVIREGILQMLPSEQIVPGDLILLEAGDRVPADGRIVDLAHLSADEASLTGESVPVSKTKDVLEKELPLGDRKNMVFMGTTIARGKGHLIVTGTGLDTEIGKIASKLLGQKKEQTPLQHRLNQLGKRLVYICLAVVVVVFGLGVLRGNSVEEMLLVALSLAVAAIPEGLPAAVTIALSIGVRKMAEKNALIRRLSSVETLGSTNVICTDKTGTLTQNVMTVRTIWTKDQEEHALKIGTLCNNANILQEKGEWVIAGDPTEGAILIAARKAGLSKNALELEYPIIEEIPFDSERKMMSVLRKENGEKTLFVKGAPDTLLERSKHQLIDGKEVALGDAERKEILETNASLASKAYRVLAVAYQTNMQAPLEEDLVFVGLIAMMDPPRPEAKEALEQCRLAGIRTVMMTGDHKQTAIAIAQELGMDSSNAVDGKELESMKDEELENISVFSRISAEHKLRIIESFKKAGKVTAMTGDGVNDAPAVLAADIGVSMGITGTDVTKESSDMIILDDNFASIVKAVEQGRGIYDNIVKFVSYLLSSNIAEILVIFITMLIGAVGPAGQPFVALLPVQLLWMNLVTDGFPAISLAMDPIDPRAMKRAPRPRSEEILNRRFSLFILSISLLVTAGALTACFIGLKTSVALAQTMTFTTLIVLELVRVQMIRKQYRMKLFSNPYLIWALSSSFVLQLLVLYVPSLQKVFATVPLNLFHWGIIFSIAFILWFAGLAVTKMFYRK
ncbi:MAG: Calcium-transporting ATPase [Chlamydiae bacterium]|nr:Calcium-transporting ATPase [Chlamydiota bacterium]